MTARLVLMGGGKMGEALVAGLLRSGWATPDDLVVVEKLAARRQELEIAHPKLTVQSGSSRSRTRS